MKIIFTDSCGDCPYFMAKGSFSQTRYFCNKNGKGITDIGLIPLWCPLSDASQQKDATDDDFITCPVCNIPLPVTALYCPWHGKLRR